jgi:hypothetical protein
MTEVVADLDRRLVDEVSGQEYFVNVAGEQLSDGTWEAWLEFIPLDDSEPLLTRTETHQRTRADVAQWAEALTDVYIQGAFDRAVGALEPPLIPTRRIATQVFPPTLRLAAAFDPFKVLLSGEVSLRARLHPLTRAELLAIIDTYKLNPASLSLTRLTNRQLITFIVTATRVQHKVKG